MNAVQSAGQLEPNGRPSSRLAGIPRWVKVFVVVAVAVVVLMVVAMIITGGQHGPGRHRSASSISERTAASAACTDPDLGDAR